MNRRALASVWLALALAACGGGGSSAPAPPAPVVITPIPDSADVKSFRIGVFEAAALRDGAFQVANDNLTFATNKTKAEVASLLTANGLSPDTIDLSVQPLIVKTGDKVLLFDAGASNLMGPTAGKLPASLAATGIAPASVTDIFVSHGHGDHVGGLAPNNVLFFPNAMIHISASEWASLKAQASMAALVAAITPKVVEFQADADILPGVVRAVDIKGHTPGHSGFRITSGAASLLYIGDSMHHSVISVQQPDWTMAADADHTLAEASRKALIESSALSGQRAFAVHFPFPGIGRFEKQGEKYVWVAG